MSICLVPWFLYKVFFLVSSSFITLMRLAMQAEKLWCVFFANWSYLANIESKKGASTVFFFFFFFFLHYHDHFVPCTPNIPIYPELLIINATGNLLVVVGVVSPSALASLLYRWPCQTWIWRHGCPYAPLIHSDTPLLLVWPAPLWHGLALDSARTLVALGVIKIACVCVWVSMCVCVRACPW